MSLEGGCPSSPGNCTKQHLARIDAVGDEFAARRLDVGDGEEIATAMASAGSPAALASAPWLRSHPSATAVRTPPRGIAPAAMFGWSIIASAWRSLAKRLCPRRRGQTSGFARGSQPGSVRRGAQGWLPVPPSAIFGIRCFSPSGTSKSRWARPPTLRVRVPLSHWAQDLLAGQLPERRCFGDSQDRSALYPSRREAWLGRSR